MPHYVTCTNDITVGKVWKLIKKVNSKIEPYLIGLKKFSSDNSSPFISKIKTEGIEII
jgi:hypothetical protein